MKTITRRMRGRNGRQMTKWPREPSYRAADSTPCCSLAAGALAALSPGREPAGTRRPYFETRTTRRAPHIGGLGKSDISRL